MFDWDDEENGVTNTITIWSNFKERDHIHIVPHPDNGEDDSLKIQQKSTSVNSTEPSIDLANNHLPDPDPDSYFCSKDEFPDSRLDVDPWPHFPSVNSGFEKGSSSPTSSIMISGFSDAPNFDNATDTTFTELCAISDNNNPSAFGEKNEFNFATKVELDPRPRPSDISSEQGYTEFDNFLECDWGSMTNFDDLDGIFRNRDSMFGHEMICDELLSPTSSINTMSSSFTIPDISSKNEVPMGKDSSAFQGNEKSQGKRKSSEDVKEDEQEKSIKSRKKNEDKNAKKSRNENVTLSFEGNQVWPFENYVPVSNGLQSFTLPATAHQSQVRPPGYFNFYSPSQHEIVGYGYPAFHFPSVPVLSHAHAIQQTTQLQQPSYNFYPQHRHTDSTSQTQQDVSPRTPMTLQEKIEKLRRRQKLQAMLAIKQQEKEFSQQNTCMDFVISEKQPQMNQQKSSTLGTTKTVKGAKEIHESELNVLVGQEDILGISVTSSDSSLQESVLHELQEMLTKLEKNLRLSMRDSFFRLARSAAERRNASDEGSSNISARAEDGACLNEAKSAQNRSLGMLDSERNTNRIDRIVAHLLFSCPPSSSTELVKQENPMSPVSENLVLEHLKIRDHMSDNKAGIADSVQGVTTL